VKRLAALALLSACAGVLALAGCTTVTTTTSDGNVVPTPPQNVADPSRRAQARLELAALYFSRGQNQTALDEIRQALAARPDMPEAIGLAQEIGIDPRPFVVAVMFAASASFATPIGYQTNTLVYRAGGYKFMDFVRFGSPLNWIFVVVAAFVIPVFWPLVPVAP
jgi:hypothetical protein